MRVGVRIHADFHADLRAQLRWVRPNRDRASIERSRTGIDEAIDLVSTFPDAGSLERQRGSVVLRKLILRRLPYVVWFARDTRDTSNHAWFLRLFHIRQDRPRGTTLPALRPRR